MKIFLLFLFFFILLSCTTDKKKPKTLSGNSELIKYKILPKEKDVLFSDLIDSIKYISLEMTHNSILTNIETIKTDTNLFFILDRQPKLFVFDDTGKFICQVGTQGRGPTEWFTIHDFYLDRRNKNVCIIDDAIKKILYYDYSGQFIRSVNIEENIRLPKFAEMDFYGDLIVHYPMFMENIKNHSNYQYKIFSLNGENISLKREVFDNFVTSKKVTVSFANHPISYTKDHILMLSQLSNVIYEYKNGELSEKYIVETNKDIIEKSIVERMNEGNYFQFIDKLKEEDKYFIGLNHIVETDQYLMLNLESHYSLIWDKEEKKGVAFSSAWDDLTNLRSNPMFTRFRTGRENFIIGLEKPTNLEVDDTKEFVKKSNSKLISNLKMIIDDIDIEDNPLIIKYYLRKDIVTHLLKDEK